MKTYIYSILSFILVLNLSCEHKVKKAVIKPKVKKLVWHIQGLPDFSILRHSYVIYDRWGMDCFIEGCMPSVRGTKENKRTTKILEKRHGKFWHEVFWQSVNEEFANRFAVNDLLNKNEQVIAKRASLQKKSEKLTSYVKPIGKYKYAVLMRNWEIVNGEDTEVIAFRFIVDLEKKTVVPNSKAMDKSILEEGTTIFRRPKD